MDCRDYGLYPPGQTISGVDPYGIPMLQVDGVYTYFGSYYHNPYAQQAQEYHDPWQLNHMLQPFESQQNPVNGNMPRETSGDEQGDSWNDLASDDGIEFNDAAWEDQIPYSGMYQVQDYQHFDNPWQLNHVHQQFQLQQNLVNGNVAGEISGMNSDDGIEFNDAAWEEYQIPDSGMYQVEYQVPLGDMHPYDATGIQSDFVNIYMYMEVPQEGANEGLQEDAILNNLKTRRYVKEDDDHEPEICVVCQLDYEDKEIVGTLGCGHQYHSDCIKTWLLQKNVCPLCNQTAIVL